MIVQLSQSMTSARSNIRKSGVRLKARNAHLADSCTFYVFKIVNCWVLSAVFPYSFARRVVCFKDNHIQTSFLILFGKLWIFFKPKFYHVNLWYILRWIIWSDFFRVLFVWIKIYQFFMLKTDNFTNPYILSTRCGAAVLIYNYPRSVLSFSRGQAEPVHQQVNQQVQWMNKLFQVLPQGDLLSSFIHL